ncbi:ABC transporter permease [Escherichia coli]|uniref:ABC transporter permease n=1 Tax=Escherichia coli TaxID=562 RepID=A0A447Y039_ECOLX|nr:ABC transporter permease [Escherichia coli]
MLVSVFILGVPYRGSLLILFFISSLFFTQYPGDGAADFHDYPQPVQRRSGGPERGFSAVDYAFRLYISDRQYARVIPRGDVHYSRTLFRQHPCKACSSPEYSGGTV